MFLWTANAYAEARRKKVKRSGPSRSRAVVLSCFFFPDETLSAVMPSPIEPSDFAFHHVAALDVRMQLRLQELCDTVSDLLDKISKHRAAQHHLFHDIHLAQSVLPRHRRFSTLDWYDEAAASRRLFSVLEASPHPIPCIRRLRIALERDTLKALSTITFSNLREVVFHRRAGGAAEKNAIALAARLLSSPFIHRVGLMGTILSGKHDLQRLFHDCPQPWPPLLLHHVIVGDGKSQMLLPHDIRKLYEESRRTIRHLSVDAKLMRVRLASIHPSMKLPTNFVPAQNTVGREIHAETPQADLLARFPALTHLALACNAREPDAETILVALPPENRLQSFKMRDTLISRRSPASSCFRGEIYMLRDNLKWRLVNSPFISLQSLLSTMTENAITKPGAFSRPRVEHSMFIDIPGRKKLNVLQCHSLAKSIELANVPDTDTATALCGNSRAKSEDNYRLSIIGCFNCQIIVIDAIKVTNFNNAKRSNEVTKVKFPTLRVLVTNGASECDLELNLVFAKPLADRVVKPKCDASPGISGDDLNTNFKPWTWFRR
ncbi:hypothetical protein C8R43DRAFT_949808 [Mycena crocata]|nr:hypothetical protein C8R43DRAFT_949808 [Mycena crocata]